MSTTPVTHAHDPVGDRLGGMGLIVTQERRQHLYHTANALRRAGRLRAFATGVWVGRPGTLRALRKVAPTWRGIRRRLDKLLTYHDRRIAEHAQVLRRGFVRDLGSWALGARLSKANSPLDLCRQLRCGLHTTNLGAWDYFPAMRAEGLPCVLEQMLPDRRAGRALLEEEELRLGLRADETWRAFFTDEFSTHNEAEWRDASVIVCISEFIASSLRRAGVEPGKLVVARCGVDVNRFKPAYLARAPGQPLRVAFVGNEVVRKGLVYAARAAMKVGPPGVEVHVFGSAKLPDHLFAEVGGVVRYRGAFGHEGLARELACCHAGVLPTLWEGFAYAVFESLACGLPMVVSQNTPAEVEDGVDGFIVPLRDVDQTAAAYELLMDEPRRQAMARAAVQRMERLTWERYEIELLRGLGLTATEAWSPS